MSNARQEALNLLMELRGFIESGVVVSLARMPFLDRDLSRVIDALRTELDSDGW